MSEEKQQEAQQPQEAATSPYIVQGYVVGYTNQGRVQFEIISEKNDMSQVDLLGLHEVAKRHIERSVPSRTERQFLQVSEAQQQILTILQVLTKTIAAHNEVIQQAMENDEIVQPKEETPSPVIIDTTLED